MERLPVVNIDVVDGKYPVGHRRLTPPQRGMEDRRHAYTLPP